MNKTYITIFHLAILPFISTITEPAIHIILTAALADHHYELRKEQYIESFQLLKTYGFENVYVVEALKKKGPTFLDDYSTHVFYSHANNPSILPGYNEALTLLDAVYHFGFDPEDIIIKLTGRHHFVSDAFIRYIEAHQDGDIFVKEQNLTEQSPHEIHTIAFGMRCKYLIAMGEWLKQIFPTLSSPRTTPLEMLQCSFIRALEQQKTIKVHYVKSLGVRARLHGSTTAPNIEDRYVYR